MNIKICGNTSQAGVDAAVRYGATHLGFIMSKSRRQVAPEFVRQLTKNVPASVKKVGVFVNEPIDFVKKAASTAGLDMVQLHGDEDMDYIRQIDLPIIKAVSTLKQAVSYENVILLFDSPKGGSGETFDWESLELSALTSPYFIAGGLNPDNVADAIDHFPAAYGVDVSSGVETDGQKDPEKIRQFIENARSEFDKILEKKDKGSQNPET